MKVVLGVEIPRKACCADHVAPFDAFAAGYFAAEPVVVWKGSRGFAGKSLLLATLSMTEQITLGAGVNLLGGSGEQAERVHDYMSGEDKNTQGMFWDASLAPRWMLRTDPTKRLTRLNNGGYVKALMASQASVRGPHPQRLRLDEIDEMEEDIFDAAMGQTMEGGTGITPQTVCSSTHQYPDGMMTEVLRRAEEQDWPVYEWCYRETLEPHGWLKTSEVARKKREVPQKMWEVEYELQEPSAEDRAIDLEAVEDLFDDQLGIFEGEAQEEIRVGGEVDTRWHSYYHGADWARTQDWTILHTMERRSTGPDHLAAWLRTGRRPWPVMIGQFNDRVLEYGGPAAHDVTGIGDVVGDYLTVAATGVDFRNKTLRDNMLSSYIVAIENRELVYPVIRYAYREHKYATWDDLYGTGHLPDTISAGGLSWWAREHGAASHDSSEWGTRRR